MFPAPATAPPAGTASRRLHEVASLGPPLRLRRRPPGAGEGGGSGDGRTPATGPRRRRPVHRPRHLRELAAPTFGCSGWATRPRPGRGAVSRLCVGRGCRARPPSARRRPRCIPHDPHCRPRTPGGAQPAAERRWPGDRSATPPPARPSPRQAAWHPPAPRRQRLRQNVFPASAQARQEPPPGCVQQHLGVIPRALPPCLGGYMPGPLRSGPYGCASRPAEPTEPIAVRSAVRRSVQALWGLPRLDADPS